MIVSSIVGYRHRIDAYESADDTDHTLTLSLRIRIFDDSDYGRYTCFASNRFGQSEDSMTLFGQLYTAFSQSIEWQINEIILYRVGQKNCTRLSLK